MNRTRLTTYEQVRSEIQSYIEARRSQFAFKTVATKERLRSNGCEGLWLSGKKCKKGKSDGKNGKEGGKGQNQTESDVVRWHCEKNGRLSTGMLVEPKEPFWLWRRQQKGGKGKSKNGLGKGAGSLEEGNQAAAGEQLDAIFAAIGLHLRTGSFQVWSA